MTAKCQQVLIRKWQNTLFADDSHNNVWPLERASNKHQVKLWLRNSNKYKHVVNMHDSIPQVFSEDSPYAAFDWVVFFAFAGFAWVG